MKIIPNFIGLGLTRFDISDLNGPYGPTAISLEVTDEEIKEALKLWLINRAKWRRQVKFIDPSMT